MSAQSVAIRKGNVGDKCGVLESGSDALSNKTKNSLKYYKWEAASQCDETATGYYGASYIAMYGGAEGLGILGSMIHLFSGLLYIKLPAAAEALGSRKRAVLIIGLLDAITWLPLVFAFLFFQSLPLFIFIALWVISIVPAIIITPLLFSWVSDLIPVNQRGRYFGMRSIIGGAAYLGLFYAMGHLLNLFNGRLAVGYAIIFFIAFAGQMISWFIYRRMYEPKQTEKKDECFGFIDFMKAARHSNLGKFIIYVSLLNFTIYLALPFLSVFILEDLGYSYALFTLLMLSQTGGKLLSLGLWGRFADMKGNLQMIAIVSILTPIAPFLWLISRDVIFLIFAMLFSGVVWAGLELCAPNFVYEAAPAGRGMKYVSYYRGLSEIAMAIGMLMGGYLATHIYPIMNIKLLTLFVLSGITSIIVIVIMLPRLSEVRPLAHWKPKTNNKKWGLSYNSGPKKATVKSVEYQPTMAFAGYTQAAASANANVGEVKVCKGLYNQLPKKTSWGRPLAVNNKGIIMGLNKQDNENTGANTIEEQLSENSPDKNNEVARQGLYYRPKEWAKYSDKASSNGTVLGLGADKI
jgi:MFS family permease